MPDDPLITTNLVRPADRDEVGDFLNEVAAVCRKYNAHLGYDASVKGMALWLPNAPTLKSFRVAAVVHKIWPLGADFDRGVFESPTVPPKFERSPQQDAVEMGAELRKLGVK